jgi:Family of unknown function (DUF6065)
MSAASNGLIEVWRLHPRGCRVEPAESTLGGDAPESARKFCGPYMQANRIGFYLFSPVDVDITWDEGDNWRCDPGENFWTDDELIEISRMTAGRADLDQLKEFIPRTKLFLAGAHCEPQHTAQLWTGCIFRTPPGWGLWLRNPVNRGYEVPFRVEEAILETAWLHQDIWLNLRFLTPRVTANLRRIGPPIAHILPIPYDALDGWKAQSKEFHPWDPESQKIFDWWREYNREKFCPVSKTGKDSSIYHRRRRAERHQRSVGTDNDD